MTNYFTVFEWSKPVSRDSWLSAEAGIYFWTIAPGVVIVTDDQANTGFYQWTNSVRQLITSIRVDGKFYSQTTSLADCRIVNESFYYDPVTTYLYVHFNNFDPPLGKIVFYGVATGKIKGLNDTYIFNDVYYEPNLINVFDVSFQKDPLYFGKMVFSGGAVTIANDNGEYDDFGDRDLFGQPAREMIGQYGDTYDKLQTIYSGFIADYSINWLDLKIDIQDKRESLKKSVAENLLTLTEYPYLSDNNENKPKPIAYGINLGAPAVSLQETQATANYTFLICDTQYNTIESVEEIRVAGAPVTPVSVDLVAGTFVLSSGTLGGNHGEVEVDFTMPIKNGIEIIIDLMANHGNTPYLSSFWDIDDISAQTVRDTSLYIADETKLWESIETVCNDIDCNFIVRPDGRFTIRVYNPNKEPIKIIRSYDWTDAPDTTNNATEFISSAVVEYAINIKSGDGLLIENTDYQDASFDKYKSLNKERFKTNLTTAADANDKASSILETSSIIQDIVTRSVSFEAGTGVKNQDILPLDIIIASPMTRAGQPDVYKYYEVLGVSYNLTDYTISLTLRKISDQIYTDPVFIPWTDNAGNYMTDNAGVVLLFKGI